MYFPPCSSGGHKLSQLVLSIAYITCRSVSWSLLSLSFRCATAVHSGRHLYRARKCHNSRLCRPKSGQWFTYLAGFTNGTCMHLNRSHVARAGSSPQLIFLVKMARCSHASCTKISIFNAEGSTTTVNCKLYCVNCIVNVHSRRYSSGACANNPSFNVEGKETAAYCKHNAEDGMINVHECGCLHATCMKARSNMAANCRHHAEEACLVSPKAVAYLTPARSEGASTLRAARRLRTARNVSLPTWSLF